MSHSSGTEEEYDELTQLLEDIATYRRDVLTVLNNEKEAKKKKEEEDKKRAEEMRTAAMETLSSRCIPPSSWHSDAYFHNMYTCLRLQKENARKKHQETPQLYPMTLMMKRRMSFHQV